MRTFSCAILPSILTLLARLPVADLVGSAAPCLAWTKKYGVAGPATPQLLARTLGAQVSFGVPVLEKDPGASPSLYSIAS
jgi:hypothetical protein